MPTPTLTRDTTVPATVHQPARIELWLAKHAAQPGQHEDRQRSPAAVEAEPQSVHATSAETAY